MQLTEVSDKRRAKEFLDVARKIYRNDPNWVCPLDNDINAIFDPEQNTFFENGEAERWVLKDNDGELIGRVAAFINRNNAFNYDFPVGGMGFFECIDDKNAAFILFDRCKEWLQQRGMQAMDGPINFGENDSYWGLLVDGFTQPAYGMNYNAPYYQKFFEDYGFKVYYEQVSNHLDITVPFPDRFWKIADWVLKKPNYHFEHLRVNNLEKYIDDFIYIYNKAWTFHESFTPMNRANMLKAFNKAKPVIDERLIWFAYVDNEPAGFFVLFPDINQVIKHMNGKMNPWAILKFLYYKKIRKVINRGRIVIMGVIPKYQRSGIESGIFAKLRDVVLPLNQYKELEISWVGDFNPKMRLLVESVGAKFAKRHYTYRKLFSESMEFKRSSIIPKDTKEKLLEGTVL